MKRSIIKRSLLIGIIFMFIGASIVPIISADQGNPPIISSESPADEAEDIPITTSSLSVFIYDIDGDTLDWTITTFPVIGYNCGYDEDDGTKTCNISGLLEYGTTYTWTVTATDSNGLTTTKTFTFTTEQNIAPKISYESPADEATDVPITTSSLSAVIYDPNEDTFDWSITTIPYIGSNSKINDIDGTKKCNISGLLEYGTTYTWTVTATDFYGKTTTKTFTFTTRPENYSPEFLDENPSNNSIDISPSLSELSVMIGDREGDRFSWTIETFPDIGSSSGNDEYNGTKICPVSSLEYSKTYTWKVTAIDSGSGISTEESYTFNTFENLTPSEPIIMGPSSGEQGVSYDYIFNATDPEDDEIFYVIHWGDTPPGEEEIVGPYSPGINVTVEHTWVNPGLFNIKAYAMDEYGCGDPKVKEVNIAQDWDDGDIEIGFKPFNINCVETIIINNLDESFSNVECNMTVECEFINNKSNFTQRIITLEPGANDDLIGKLYKFPLFGKMTIDVSVLVPGYPDFIVEKHITGFKLGPFVLIF